MTIFHEESGSSLAPEVPPELAQAWSELQRVPAYVERYAGQHPAECREPFCPCHGEDSRAARVLDAVIDGEVTLAEAYRLVNGLQVL